MPITLCNYGKYMNKTNKLYCQNGSFEVLVAKSFFSRFLGLMFVSPKNFYKALLITNCSSIHTFFMRFCIDLVFLDKNNMVLKVIDELKPWRIVAPVVVLFAHLN